MVSSLSIDSRLKAIRIEKRREMGRLYRKREGKRRKIKKRMSPRLTPLFRIRSIIWKMRPRSRITVRMARIRKKEEKISFTI